MTCPVSSCFSPLLSSLLLLLSFSSPSPRPRPRRSGGRTAPHVDPSGVHAALILKSECGMFWLAGGVAVADGRGNLPWRSPCSLLQSALCALEAALCLTLSPSRARFIQTAPSCQPLRKFMTLHIIAHCSLSSQPPNLRVASHPIASHPIVSYTYTVIITTTFASIGAYASVYVRPVQCPTDCRVYSCYKLGCTMSLPAELAETASTASARGNFSRPHFTSPSPSPSKTRSHSCSSVRTRNLVAR